MRFASGLQSHLFVFTYMHPRGLHQWPSLERAAPCAETDGIRCHDGPHRVLRLRRARPTNGVGRRFARVFFMPFGVAYHYPMLLLPKRSATHTSDI